MSFVSWRMAAVGLLGFASGLPLALTAQAMQAWMGHEGFDYKKIGAFGACGVAVLIEVLWSPLMDRYVPPFLDAGAAGYWSASSPLSASILGMAAVGLKGGVDACGGAVHVHRLLQRQPGHRHRRLPKQTCSNRGDRRRAALPQLAGAVGVHLFRGGLAHVGGLDFLACRVLLMAACMGITVFATFCT